MVFRGQTLGKYRILEPLGSGGFGTVYLAEDTWIDKRVAIKVPHRQNLDFGELLREPRLLASLNHPNIVTVITAEKQDNVFFIVMEYVPGETLENDHREPRARSTLALALDYTCQIANAVEHAHKQGVIHRDLRPANVFVTDKGLLKVGDFGTSRFLEIAAHGTTVIGSPPYMAPEQFEGRAVFASDLYSLGVTMYQMLTGVLPYDTPAPADLDRLRRGELVVAAAPAAIRRFRRSIDDIVHARARRRRGRTLSARRGSAATTCSGARRELVRASRRRVDAGRRGGRRAAPARGPRRATSGDRPRAAHARGRRRAGSAGTAASRCPRAARAARFVVKRSRIVLVGSPSGTAAFRRRLPWQGPPSAAPARCG